MSRGAFFRSCRGGDAPLEPAGLWWTDFSQVDKRLAALRDYPGYELHGVQVWPLRLTQFIDTGEVVAQHSWFDVELLRLPPANDYEPNKLYDEVLAQWSALWWPEPISYEELLKLGYTFLEPRRLVLEFWLADVNDKPLYEKHRRAYLDWLAGQAESSGGRMLLSEGGCTNGCPVIETNEFVICDISFDSSNQTATITFESCNTHFYDVYSADDLTNAVWEFRTNLLGRVDSTVWTDYDDLSVLTSRFYSVVRLASRDDPDSDGLSNSQEARLGTNPYNRDTDGDGVWDGPFNPNNVAGVSYSLSGIPDAFPTDPTRSVDTDGDGLDDLTQDTDDDNDGLPDITDPDPVVPITVAPFKTVGVETNNVGGDTGTELFDVSARGRPLPCAAGSSAQHGFGRLYGGIYFNHDATNLYIGIAGFDIEGTNVLVVVLDTDGATGGITNFAAMNPANPPFGITRSRNLLFGTNFTPNVAILVGSKFGDGQNFPNFQIPGNGHDFGQGVYGLSATAATNFPGFAGPGARISQWGDLNTLYGDPPRTHSANAGIEIAISKSALGLTNGAIFRAAAIVAGGTDASNNRFFSREAYGESLTGGTFPNNPGFAATTLIGAPVYLSTNPPPAYAPFTGITDNDVMMQGFYWDVPKVSATNGDWYVELAGRAVDLSTNGFTAVWFPPPQKGENGRESVGYDPFDHYDLGGYDQRFTVETRYGSRAELQAAVDAFRSVGIKPYVDVVPNHMKGGAPGPYYTNYVAGYFQKSPSDFYVGTSNLVCTPFHRQIDFGDEVNQTVPHMRQGLNAWGEWLTSAVGFEGFRVDHSNGMEPWWQAEFLGRPANSNKFAVLEYNIDASPREMRTWVQLVDQRASLFDFRLHDKLVQMCGPATNGFNIAQMYKAGLAGIAPEFAVTFVENHDTIHPCFGDRSEGIKQDKILAYAYTLISEGYPTVFYHDYYFNSVGDSNQCFLAASDPIVATQARRSNLRLTS